MKVSQKICLIIAIFFISATGVWAGFNYDSAQNYFLIDSFLKAGGNSIVVGNVLNDNLKNEAGANTTNFLGISDNLIFLDSAGEFKSGTRLINKDTFSTSAINFKTNHNVVIMPIGGVGSLSLPSDNVNMNQNFRVKGGMAFDGRDLSGIMNKNLYVDWVWASQIKLLSVDQLIIPSQTLLVIAQQTGGMQITADRITFDNAPFCEIETWNVQENVDDATVVKTDPDTDPDATVDADETDHCTDTSTKSKSSKRTCCKKYFSVFDMNAKGGKMVCCRFSSARLSL
jgi:hypothetical protein